VNKNALCIGINKYPGNAALSGCVNDANDWADVLIERGFNVEMMLDEQATLSNIVARLHALMSGSRYRDRLVVTYSGHGTYGHDESGDEGDKRDEAICPVDCFHSGMLYDDEIKNIMSARAYGSRLTFISDSCFSGSVNRFAGFEHQRRFTDARAKFLPAQAMPYRKKAITRPIKKLAGTPALLLSGCDDTQFSYDAWFGPRPNGAFSRVAIDALKEFKPSTMKQWHRLIRETLPNNEFPQSPELEGSAYRKTWSPL
jgi:hypothetical protein